MSNEQRNAVWAYRIFSRSTREQVAARGTDRAVEVDPMSTALAREFPESGFVFEPIVLHKKAFLDFEDHPPLDADGQRWAEWALTPEPECVLV